MNWCKVPAGIPYHPARLLGRFDLNARLRCTEMNKKVEMKIGGNVEGGDVMTSHYSYSLSMKKMGGAWNE